ncbi:MAG: hypothetical protein WBA22_14330 [Candidatus Methanofastidiosia archaeon]
MFAKIKKLLWSLGLTDDVCPYCSAKLKRHGWYPNERYTCPDPKCQFNLEKKVKRNDGND